MNPELAQLLYPVFTHLYLQLVLKGNKSEAQQFHAKHHGTFVGNGEFARFVYLLTSILEPDDLTRSGPLTQFIAFAFLKKSIRTNFKHTYAIEGFLGSTRCSPTALSRM